MATYTKDPEAVLEFGVRWADWLDDDTIETSSWALIPTGSVEIDFSTHDSTTATVWLSGGTHGQVVKARNHIVTDDGRTDERTLTIHIQDR